MDQKIKIGLVDDDFRTTDNLKDFLSFSPKIQIELIAHSGKEFLEKMKSLPTTGYPEVVLMDIDMPNISGIDVVLMAKSKYPSVKFLMLTVYDDEEKLFQAIKAGASGYLLKDEKVSVIIDHIEKLQDSGGAPMSPIMAQKTLELLMKAEIKNDIDTPNFALTDREKEVLKLMVDGKNYKEIGHDLFISKNTAKKHTANIYEKLHVSSKAAAIKMVHLYRLL